MKPFSKFKAGFSLAEVVIATAIGSFVLTASYATVISLAQGSESMINYSEMNTQTRHAIEIFGRDSRMASDVIYASSTTLVSKNSVWNGSDYVDRWIKYEYQANPAIFKRKVYDIDDDPLNVNVTPIEDRTLLFDVQTLKFTYYSLINQADPLTSPETTRLLEIKHVQLEAELQREVLSITNTNYIISARFMLRNKDVSS